MELSLVLQIFSHKSKNGMYPNFGGYIYDNPWLLYSAVHSCYTATVVLHYACDSTKSAAARQPRSDSPLWLLIVHWRESPKSFKNIIWEPWISVQNMLPIPPEIIIKKKTHFGNANWQNNLNLSAEVTSQFNPQYHITLYEVMSFFNSSYYS